MFTFIFKNTTIVRILFLSVLLVLSITSQDLLAQNHPNLILTKKGVADIKSQLGTIPIFDQTLATVKKEVDAEISKGIQVPIPKDMAGGFTHTQHKSNYNTMQKAGVLFQLLGDETYAIYVRDMLMAYAKMYPSLPLHPQERSYSRGKIFWQCLNDANWLVYTSQAYDCIYDWLLPKERTYLNKNLFRPFADFLSVETPQFFNRIHNHSTWGNVAVGMIGLVMDDNELIDRALYGLKEDHIDPAAKDNDGGFIKKPGQKAGFFANLDDPFSPSGYYTEGPYYQRYTMYPFMIFAEALQNKKPELKIFEYKDGLLIKAVDALLNLTDDDGEFFPLNDAQKGMSYYSSSLVSALDIAYYYGEKDPSLLSIAKDQGEVQLDETGLAVAIGLRDKKEQPFVKKSIELTDGAKGDEGGVGILRYNNKKHTMALVMKYSAQGLSHGHYDKLSFSLYENGDEVLQDYGLARFVNIEQKNGGGYLKENKTWAKQTIAHNSLVQDQTSHFNGDFETGSAHHSVKYLFDATNSDFQIVSAKEQNAYPGTELHRTMVMVKDASFDKPFIIDLVKVSSNATHQYDLPYYYLGQVISTNFKYETPKSLETLGSTNGYQHLWKEAQGTSGAESAQFTWLNHDRFYSITSATKKSDELIFARIGANDPEFNLRKDPAYILRKSNSKDIVFASIIESHGSYNAVTESAKNAYSKIENVNIVYDERAYTAISITYTSGTKKLFILSNNEESHQQKHAITIDGEVYNWVGPYHFGIIK